MEDEKVECLGSTFETDEERRRHFLAQLGEKLADPEFRKIEGFPIGSDEDILRLSDPPYFTACPNPWIDRFLTEHSTPYDATNSYHREPFAADVSEGKNLAIYNAHAYHTKVPHRAIMRYILHYTEPGDLIVDLFAGTGMTGVAAKLCGDRNEVIALGYRVREDGAVLDAEGRAFSTLGPRRVILNDLSPAAAFIAHNFNAPIDPDVLEREARRILTEVEAEWGWMYHAVHTDGRTLGRMNYTVWSDVFTCTSCQGEVVFLDAAVNEDGEVSADAFECPSCRATLSKATVPKRMERALTHHGHIVERIKKVPVFVNYSTSRGRRERPFSHHDEALLEKVARQEVPLCCPSVPLDKKREQYKRDALHLRGIETASDFYTRRNLIALGHLWERASCSSPASLALRFWLTSIQWLASNMYRHREGGGGGQQGKLTIPSLIREQNVFRLAAEKLQDVLEVARTVKRDAALGLVATSDASAPGSEIRDCVDYIFVDPPFGGNIFYSDLNCIWEGWLRVWTNDKTEAVVHRVQAVQPKRLGDYAALMKLGLQEAFKALKPGRWITIEFSNSQAAVWNAIQTSLQEAGFVVANVAALDKKQRSFRSVTSPTAVKQDLVISAYKPNRTLEEEFAGRGRTPEGAWDFISAHLRNLPVVKARSSELEFVAERDPRILYDRMVAFYIGHETPVPLSSAEFQAALSMKYPERDGMYFLPEQVSEFDRRRAHAAAVGQLSIFVDDERSAISWLHTFLRARPSTYQDIQPAFMQQLGASWKKFEHQLELSALLDQNFLCYDGTGDVPNQIHAYLSTQFKELRHLAKSDARLRSKATSRWYVPDPTKASDLEKLRERILLKEFEEYRGAGLQKRLKTCRIEAVRCGFKCGVRPSGLQDNCDLRGSASGNGATGGRATSDVLRRREHAPWRRVR